MDRRPHSPGCYRDTGLKSVGGVCLAPGPSSRDRDPKCERVPRADTPPIHLACIALHWLAGDRRHRAAAPSRVSPCRSAHPHSASPRVLRGCAPQSPRLCIPGGGEDPEVSRGCRGAGEECTRRVGGGVPGLQRCHSPGRLRLGQGTGAARSRHQPPPPPPRGLRRARPRRASPCAWPGRARATRGARDTCWSRSGTDGDEAPGTPRAWHLPVLGPPQTVSSGKCLGLPRYGRLSLWNLLETANSSSLPGQASTICTTPHTCPVCQISSLSGLAPQRVPKPALAPHCAPACFPAPATRSYGHHRVPLSPKPFPAPGAAGCASALTAWWRQMDACYIGVIGEP